MSAILDTYMTLTEFADMKGLNRHVVQRLVRADYDLAPTDPKRQLPRTERIQDGDRVMWLVHRDDATRFVARSPGQPRKDKRRNERE